MSEELMVKNCSPTLAGMKTGNIFACSFKSEDELRHMIRKFNRLLTPKGIRVIPLRMRDNRALIYVYRPSRLEKDINNPLSFKILSQRGYDPYSPAKCILRLIAKLYKNEEFPHEIGLFLGYPPEDVLGFIENRAENFKCVGCWKVYSDAERAEKLFKKYKKCTEVYCLCHASGRPMEKLAVGW